MADLVERLLFPAEADGAKSPGEQTLLCNARPPLGETEDELVLSAKRKLTLRCGKSSITLHPNGKIVLRGEYILSDAEGTNRINGGRVEIN